ncbi:MAG: type II secretion system protein [Verrucomicrobiales bacterium]
MKSNLVHAPSSSSPANRSRLRHAAAFTLVELLTVIAIIVLLVGLTIGILGFAQSKAAKSKAEGQMQLLITGLMRYEKEYGEFPEPVDNSGEGSSGAKALYQALSGDGDSFLVVGSEGGSTPSSGEVGSVGEVFVEGLDPNANKHGLVNTNYALVDPFGQVWHYRKHMEDETTDPTRNSTFDIWSFSDDRKGENDAKWIKNW